MIAEISAGFSSLKAAKDIVQAMNGVHSAVQINEVKLNLQSLILEAQQSLFVAQEEQAQATKKIEKLEQEIARFKDWEVEKRRYQLEDTGQGSLAYRLKSEALTDEPVHWICPSCYQNGKKSILKHETLAVGRTDTLVCHPCGFDIVTRGVRHEPQRQSPRAGR